MIVHLVKGEELLPVFCMRIVDWLHLHKNRLEAVKNVVNFIVTVDIKIPKDCTQSDIKATAPDLFAENGKKCLRMWIIQRNIILKMHNYITIFENTTLLDVAKELTVGISRKEPTAI